MLGQQELKDVLGTTMTVHPHNQRPLFSLFNLSHAGPERGCDHKRNYSGAQHGREAEDTDRSDAFACTDSVLILCLGSCCQKQRAKGYGRPHAGPFYSNTLDLMS
jgi:hypothetical protein